MISQVSLTSRVNNISNDEETDFTIALLMLSMPVATIEAGDSNSVEERAKEIGTMWICGGPKSTKISQEQDVPRTESL